MIVVSRMSLLLCDSGFVRGGIRRGHLCSQSGNLCLKLRVLQLEDRVVVILFAVNGVRGQLGCGPHEVAVGRVRELATGVHESLSFRLLVYSDRGPPDELAIHVVMGNEV